MNSSPTQDVSLYELALHAEQDPYPLQISPTIFKSMIDTLIELLIRSQVPTVLWMKLPRGKLWQAEVDRICKLAQSSSSVYLLVPSREPTDVSSAAPGLESDPWVQKSAATAPLAAETSPAEADADLNDYDASAFRSLLSTPESWISDQTTSSGSTPAQCRLMTLPLAVGSQLRREYFILVQSSELSVLVLAHRPRSVRTAGAESDRSFSTRLSAPPVSSGSVVLGEDEDDPTPRKHPLLGICSFNPQTLDSVLTGIRQAIAWGQTTANPPSSDVDELLTHWHQIIRHTGDAVLNPVFFGQLFTKQIQRQEEIWRSSVVYRQRAERVAALQQENEELTNAVRLKDEFLKNVGQELRTPLTNMKTALTLLDSPQLKPNQRQRYMELVTQECDRQRELITDVLKLLQLETEAENTPMQPLRLADIVPGVVSTYQPLAQEKGVMLAYTVPNDLPPVACTINWLRQVVINLLHNSIKFTPRDGEVWVTAAKKNGQVCLEFRDTGVGIPVTDIPHIFQPFYRVRHSGEDDAGGSGLGLAIVQQLLVHCGGSISVRSKLGEGSTFTVCLPLYNPTP